jgi:hypothetical protein
VISRFALAGLLAVLGVAGVIALAVLALSGGADPPPGPVESAGAATLSHAERLQRAAASAGCMLANPPDEGNEHVTRALEPADYHTNPPTSGSHSPQWASDGVYKPGRTPPLGTVVHTLEHGRIDVQYRRGTPRATITALVGLYRQLEDGHHLLVFENRTGMRYAVAATAWDHLLGCPAMNVHVLAAIKEFRDTYIDKGPEIVP